MGFEIVITAVISMLAGGGFGALVATQLTKKRAQAPQPFPSQQGYQPYPPQ